MKVFIFLGIMIFGNLQAFSQDSAVVKKTGTKVEIVYGEETVSPVEIKKINSDVVLYVVKSGEVGTSVLVTIYRGIIWSESQQKVLGMFPYRYEVSSDSPYQIDQPVWDITETRISIEDSNIDLKTSIDL